MERLIVLGAGNAMATKCYNTCFSLFDGAGHFLVDAGGGNGILRQAEEASISFVDIDCMFVSHAHTDHILGAIWVLRKLSVLIRQGAYPGIFSIYSHPDVGRALRIMAELTFTPSMLRLFDDRILFVSVGDGETRKIRGWDVVFFDLHSQKAIQLGFSLRLRNGKKLVFLGDEPCAKQCEQYAYGCDWLLSEAFCLYSEREIYKPYEKSHSTVKEACELAERLGVANLILWHTEDASIHARKKLYSDEGRMFFSGELYVPDDLDVILL